MRTVVLRVVALVMLVFLAIMAGLSVRTIKRLPDTVIYYVQNDANSFHLEAAGRRSNRTDPEQHLRYALQSLIDGPNSAETARGLSSSFPPDVTVNNLELSDGVVTVDLSSEFEQGGGSALMNGRLYQLFYTLTKPKDVAGVSLLIEGKKVQVFSGDGLIVENPWWLKDHPNLPSW